MTISTVGLQTNLRNIQVKFSNHVMLLGGGEGEWSLHASIWLGTTAPINLMSQ